MVKTLFGIVTTGQTSLFIAIGMTIFAILFYLISEYIDKKKKLKEAQCVM